MGKAEAKKTLMNFGEYARHRDVSPMTISDAVKHGLIPVTQSGTRRLIDVNEADKVWEGPRRFDSMGPAESGSKSTSVFREARAAREGYQARLTKLNYERELGNLIEKQAVLEQTVEVAKIIKAAFRAIPVKLAAELASETNPGVIEKRLLGEIDTALEELAKYESRYS